MRFLFLYILFFLPYITYAELLFECEVLECEIPQSQSQYKFSFKFKNVSSNSIRILSVKSSCSCTVATPEENIYKPNESGEIKGIFGAGKKGALVLNSDTGVYGVFSGYPSQSQLKLKTATIDEVSTGEATIRCSVTGEVGEYTVKITRINKNISGGKNFSIEVTDAKLLAITGGIVQGMSGSPIIQNGKLIGAVTHVTVNDPKCGYGIAIENMLR